MLMGPNARQKFENTLANLEQGRITPVLMIARRRLCLRTALPQPDPRGLQAWLRLFGCAVQEAQRVSIDEIDAHTPSTQPSMFSASTMPVDAAQS